MPSSSGRGSPESADIVMRILLRSLIVLVERQSHERHHDVHFTAKPRLLWTLNMSRQNSFIIYAACASLFLILLTPQRVAGEDATPEEHYFAGSDGRLRRRIGTAVINPNFTIRVDVDMTIVPVTVRDAMGHNVRGLERENFRLFDGSEQRPIVAFSQQDAPVSAGLIFDCSGSMTDKFKTARDAITELFHALNPEDESFLVTFSRSAELRQTFTSNFAEIENALALVRPKGGTSLIDGVSLGLAEMKKAHNPRKALVVVSDGGDNKSRYTLSELVNMAVESDTMIYTIGIFQNPQRREEFLGPDLLNKLSGNTGGLPFLIRDVKSLHAVMAQIGEALHNQYVLGYYPPPDASSGKYRKIKVEVVAPGGAQRLQVYARTGYYARQH
jgi:Ca-activated chloride channel family protein